MKVQHNGRYHIPASADTPQLYLTNMTQEDVIGYIYELLDKDAHHDKKPDVSVCSATVVKNRDVLISFSILVIFHYHSILHRVILSAYSL